MNQPGKSTQSELKALLRDAALIALSEQPRDAGVSAPALGALAFLHVVGRLTRKNRDLVIAKFPPLAAWLAPDARAQREQVYLALVDVLVSGGVTAIAEADLTGSHTHLVARWVRADELNTVPQMTVVYAPPSVVAAQAPRSDEWEDVPTAQRVVLPAAPSKRQTTPPPAPTTPPPAASSASVHVARHTAPLPVAKSAAGSTRYSSSAPNSGDALVVARAPSETGAHARAADSRAPAGVAPRAPSLRGSASEAARPESNNGVAEHTPTAAVSAPSVSTTFAHLKSNAPDVRKPARVIHPDDEDMSFESWLLGFDVDEQLHDLSVEEEIAVGPRPLPSRENARVAPLVLSFALHVPLALMVLFVPSPPPPAPGLAGLPNRFVEILFDPPPVIVEEEEQEVLIPREERRREPEPEREPLVEADPEPEEVRDVDERETSREDARNLDRDQDRGRRGGHGAAANDFTLTPPIGFGNPEGVGRGAGDTGRGDSTDGLVLGGGGRPFGRGPEGGRDRAAASSRGTGGDSTRGPRQNRRTEREGRGAEEGSDAERDRANRRASTWSCSELRASVRQQCPAVDADSLRCNESSPRLCGGASVDEICAAGGCP